MKSMSKERRVYLLKVGLVGSRAAGKTALARGLCGAPFEARYEASRGVRLWDALLPADGGTGPFPSVRAQLWDAPAEKEKALRALEGAVCVAVVYDVTARDSFEEACSFWVPLALRTAPDCFLMLVGCKADQFAVRAVAVEEVERFAAQRKFFFMEVSAKKGTNIDLMLSMLRIRAKHVTNEAAHDGEFATGEIESRASSLASLHRNDNEEEFEEEAVLPELPKTAGSLRTEVEEGEELTISGILGRREKRSHFFPESDSLSMVSSVRDIQMLNGQTIDVDHHYQPEHPRDFEVGSNSKFSKLNSLVSEALDERRTEPNEMAILPGGAGVSNFRVHRSGSITVSTSPEGPRIRLSQSKLERNRRNSRTNSVDFHWENPQKRIPQQQKEFEEVPNKVIRPNEMTLHKRHTKSSRLRSEGSDPSESGRSKRTSAPDLLVDVNLEGRLIGSVSVCKGDDPAVLARKFIREHDLDPQMALNLRKLLKGRMNEFYAVERESHLKKKRNEGTTGPPKLSNGRRKSFPDNRKVLGTLHVKVGPGRKGKLVIREGDDPDELVNGFRMTYGLRKQQAQQVRERIEEQLAFGDDHVADEDIPVHQTEFKNGEDREAPSLMKIDNKDDLPSPVRYPSVLTQNQRELLRVTLGGDAVNGEAVFSAPGSHNRPSSTREILFFLDVNLGRGEIERLTIFEEDDLGLVAQEFCHKHRLKEDKMKRLTFLLEEKLLLHERNKNKGIV